MFRPDDSSPVEAIIQPDVGSEQRFDHPLWKRKRDSHRRFASPHLRVLEDVFEALGCEPHLQYLKVSQKPHGAGHAECSQSSSSICRKRYGGRERQAPHPALSPEGRGTLGAPSCCTSIVCVTTMPRWNSPAL